MAQQIQIGQDNHTTIHDIPAMLIGSGSVAVASACFLVFQSDNVVTGVPPPSRPAKVNNDLGASEELIHHFSSSKPSSEVK